ncbi:MAG: calcium/sodium antiporter [Alphaproteobacteria bacterium]
MMYLMVAGGLIVLLVGGDILVRGAVALAQRLGVTPLVIGLTVVGFGTSAPELMVCVSAALDGASELAIGNVVGSNIANVLLVLGLPALIFPIACNAAGLRRDAGLMLLVSAGFVALCLSGLIGRVDGMVMLALLFGFLIWSYVNAMRGDGGVDAIAEEIQDLAGQSRSLAMSFALVLVGIVGLIGGAKLLVVGAVDIARAAGLSEAVIGLTLVAVGTSLPELATSLVAAVRRQGDVAIGNVVGSNLFNLLGIMGVTAIVRPIPIPASFQSFDLWVMLAAALLPLPFIARRTAIGRRAGAVLLLLYVGYVFALFHGVAAGGAMKV